MSSFRFRIVSHHLYVLAVGISIICLLSGSCCSGFQQPGRQNTYSMITKTETQRRRQQPRLSTPPYVTRLFLVSSSRTNNNNNNIGYYREGLDDYDDHGSDFDDDYDVDFRTPNYHYYPAAEDDEDGGHGILTDWAHSVLQTCHASFQNVERPTNQLLKEQPIVALAIFFTAALVVAYMLGVFILDGCIESWNPAQNGMVPYWDEEIHTITRRFH